MTAQDGCVNAPINFFGTQTDNITTITQWNWNFGDGTTSTLQDPVHNFSVAGNMNVVLNATANNGCVSPDATKMIDVGSVHAIASTIH
jgi:PKD repeat protein